MLNGQSRRLLDEVDVITVVSGGSFTAAYYGLFGERLFTDFAQQFLYKDIQSEMISALLSTTQWLKIGSPHYSRSDAVAEYFDRTLFEGKTFSDLSSDGRLPFVILNATDLNTGTTPTSFRLDRETVDALRQLPARMLDDSPEFRTFLQRLQPAPTIEPRQP